MKLYNYFRSSASYRVRIALNLKQVDYEAIPVHLLNKGGEQHLPQYRKLNPQELVPALDIGTTVLTQSLAIIEYLEETIPKPPLLPKDPMSRAVVRSLALIIACDIHPLNNLRVINRLKQQFHAEEQSITSWYHHWLGEGFQAIETKLQEQQRSKMVCCGEEPSLADICLIPQVFNAKRFDFSLENFPLIRGINDYCLQLPAFSKAAPE